MKVYQLIDKHQRWCKNVDAMNSKNLPVHPNCKEARRYCLNGAIIKCYTTEKKRFRVYNLLHSFGIDYIPDFNDNNNWKTIYKLAKKLGI